MTFLNFKINFTLNRVNFKKMNIFGWQRLVEKLILILVLLKSIILTSFVPKV